MAYESPKIIIDDKLTIQIYLCFLIDRLGDLTDEQLSDIITEHEAVNFLEYLEALSIAQEKELIKAEENKNKKVLSLLPKGKMMANEFYTRIPLSIREKSLEYGQYVLKMAELERSVVCRIERGGFNEPCFLTVTFLNEMGGPNLMELKIYAPDFEQAKQMRERFYEKPSDTVAKIMNMFIKDSYL